MENNFVLLAAVFAGLLLGWLIRRLSSEKRLVPRSDLDRLILELNQSKLDLARFEERVNQIRQSEQQAQAFRNKLESELLELRASNSRLTVENRHLAEQVLNQDLRWTNIGEKFEKQFKLLAQDILEAKSDAFQQAQEKNLGNLLEPLRSHISQFREEFERKYKTESDERISLREQIVHMLQLNQTLSAQAENLTRALTNNVKSQGDWGESILESILQYAGLQKDLHYFVQESSQNEAGDTIRPDVIIKYPDGRALVVDSKVSLLHYTRLIAAGDEAERKTQEALLLQSFRQHADGLSRKNYQSVADALDFVLMFVPVESAYIQAMQADTTLWQFAYQKRVLLISPTNLVPAMKLVADLWQRDGISRHATAIAERAGKLYDKLVGFVDNFDRVGSQLEKATETWRDAQKQLVQGRGNLISQAEKMREMHIKTQKKLPGNWTEQAEDEEDNLGI